MSPTDFSDEELTIASLKKAVTLADKPKIILLHILEHVPHTLSKTHETLNEWLKKSGVEAEIEVREGRTSYHEIIVFAKEKKADLILINSHKPGFGDYFLGSTASKVVRHAPCSVLVER